MCLLDNYHKFSLPIFNNRNKLLIKKTALDFNTEN